MIALAANGSPILKELLDADEISLDYVKCPLSGRSREEVSQFRPYRPVLLHGWGPVHWIGQRGVPEPDLLRELMAVSGSPYVSTHLDARPKDFDGELTPARALARVHVHVAALGEITGQDVLLENVPYLRGGPSPRFTTDPNFIAEALAASSAKFLLDLAHAKVSAWHRGEEFGDYLNALPLAAAQELHLSRPRLEADGMRDRHLPLEEDDYALLESLLPRLPRLRMVTLEYGGLDDGGPDGVKIDRNDPDALRDQLRRLHTLVRNCDAAGK